MNLQKTINDTVKEVCSEIQVTKISTDIDKLNILKNSINKVVNLSINDINTENNVRHHVDEESEDFKKLCESIKVFGLMKNLVVELRVNENDNSFKLICVAGHRRLAALKKLQINEKIPCLIKKYTTGQRIGAALSENLTREDLGCIDIANGYHSLLQNNWSMEDLEKHFEKDKKTIARYLRLAEIPEDIKENIRNNSSILTTRVIFNDILAKNKNPGEIRKAIERRLNKKEISPESKKPIHEKLNIFFSENKVDQTQQSLIISAFKYVGLLK